MADITYCSSECPFKDCERHSDRLEELRSRGVRYASIADFAPTCRRYIASVVEEVMSE